MNSFRWRMAGWFALSLLFVLGVFTGVTFLHLRHELRVEKWEREPPGHSDWVLHGSYSESEVEDIVGELAHLSLVYALPVAGLAVLLGYFLATRSLQPLADINRQLQVIGASSLSQRVRLQSADQEFRSIETNINALLVRLEGAFRQLTEFSAQVAHELRAPLTLIRLRVEDASGRIEPALAESLQDELCRLSDYVDQCLLLATAEQGRLVLKLEQVPLRALLTDLLETYELWAKSQQRVVTLAEGSEVVLTADPRYLRQILHVLLSNALRHGCGPVWVAMEVRSEGVTCRVTNAAPPSTDGEVAKGNGLGLRLARAVAGALGCELATARGVDRFEALIRWPPDHARPGSLATLRETRHVNDGPHGRG